MNEDNFKQELINIQEHLLEELNYDISISIHSSCSYSLISTISDITKKELMGINLNTIKECIDEYLKQELFKKWEQNLEKIESRIYEIAQYISKSTDKYKSAEETHTLYSEYVKEITKNISYWWIEDILTNFSKEYLRKLQYYCICFDGISENLLQEKIYNVYCEVSNYMKRFNETLIEKYKKNIEDFTRKLEDKTKDTFSNYIVEDQITFIEFLNKYNYNIIIDNNIVYLSTKNPLNQKESYHSVIIREGYLIDEYSGIKIKLPKDYINYVMYGEILQFNNHKLSIEDGKLYIINNKEKQEATFYDTKITSNDKKVSYFVDKGTNSFYCKDDNKKTEIIIADNKYFLSDEDCAFTVTKEGIEKYTIVDLKPHKDNDNRDYFYYQEKILKISPHLYKKISYGIIDLEDKNGVILERYSQVL